MEREVFKTIPGWSMYEVSTLGRVKRIAGFDTRGSYRQEQFLRLRVSSSGKKHPGVILQDKPRRWHVYVAQLMLLAFVGPRPSPKHEARHLDDISDHNRLPNLAWGTRKQNAEDAVRNGLMVHHFGSANGCSKLNEKQVLSIRKKYIPWHPKFSSVALGIQYGVGTMVIQNIVHRRTWTHI